MRLFRFLFSGSLMGILLLLFAFVIGYATFIENDYGAETAKLLVYNAIWFEAILILMVINFAGMIFTKHLYLKSKWNALAIHIALIIIIIGAGVTRYFGYEGQMHIRNGEISNEFRSTDKYLELQFSNKEVTENKKGKLTLTTYRNKQFSKNYNFQGTAINVEISDYLPNASEVIVDSENGSAYISMMVGGLGGRNQFNLKEGSVKKGYDYSISFGDTTKTDMYQIIHKEGKLFYRKPLSLYETDSNQAYLFQPLKIMAVQKDENISFLVAEFKEHGSLEFRPVMSGIQTGNKVVRLNINNQEAFLPFGEVRNFIVGENLVSVKLGSKSYRLPFALKLNAFEIERYPGSNSPSSFASEVVVIDKANNKQFPYRIYMNHILNYKGYRFFQSSYDKDEKGTVLSVNNDYWGTMITYVGYFLLFTTLILSVILKKTRFARITEQLKGVHAKRKKLITTLALVLTLGVINSNAQENNDYLEHTKSFSKLFVQNKDGRIEPVNTIANKILVKISKKNTFNGLSADQVFLGMNTDPKKWEKELIIKVPEESVQELLNISGDYASFNDFMDASGEYALSHAVDGAYNKKPAERSLHDKAIINVDERVNVLYMVLNKAFLKIFPLINDDNNKWLTPPELHQELGHGSENGDLFEHYAMNLKIAATSGDYTLANENLKAIHAYQQEFGKEILPSSTKMELEIFYNETNIFKKLFPFYLTIGVLLIAIFFLQTFKPSLEFKGLTKVFLGVLILAFITQTIGLGIRWYISGHAPWSNGFESMIYISWATMLAGFIFMKRSSITLGVTATLAGITLLTAHMSWLNPELTNLVPVLKSYWLTIHVATITASYGFLGLGGMVAFLNLCIMIFRNKNNMERVNLTLLELNLIVEMAISVGLILLIIGNFLGGIWANESWGRYWGWDPKETWTLVTIMMYTFTLHLTIIPAIRNTFTFSFMSFISFGAILMTYFGVNYYLSGLHSYAAGDPIEVPTFVFYTLGVVAIVSLLAAYNEFIVKRKLNQ